MKLRQYHVSNKWVSYLLVCLFVFSAVCSPQTSVVLSPVFKQQFFDNSGRPLAFGCVFTDQSGTTTPLPSYTDFTGATQNQNPVILDAAGRANIWLLAGQAYTIILKAAGGLQCASGTTIFSVSGVAGGGTQATTAVPFSATPIFTDTAQNQLFTFTLTGNASAQPLTASGIIPPGIITWQITQDAAGGHTFSWPANVIGGCTIDSAPNSVTTQMFIWNGVNATAIGPCVDGNGPSISTGDIAAFGNVGITGNLAVAGTTTFGGGVTVSPITSSCTPAAVTGAIRLCNTDAINWRNAGNTADYGISADTSNRGVFSFAGGLETTGAIPDIFLGGTTAAFPRLLRNGTALNIRLGDNSADAPLTASTLGLSGVLTSTAATYLAGGPELATPAAPAAAHQDGYFKAGKGWCAEDSAGHEYCTVAGSGEVVQASSMTLLGANVTVPQNVGTTFLTHAVTMPAFGCPCRALVSYGAFTDSGSSGIATAWVDDGTNQFATAQILNNDAGGTGPGVSSSSMSPVTYANSAVVTFLARVNMTNSGGGTVMALPAASTQHTWLNISIFTGN